MPDPNQANAPADPNAQQQTQQAQQQQAPQAAQQAPQGGQADPSGQAAQQSQAVHQYLQAHAAEFEQVLARHDATLSGGGGAPAGAAAGLNLGGLLSKYGPLVMEIISVLQRHGVPGV